MKTGNAEAISHTWQFAHLKHYFGNDRATKSTHSGNVQSIADRQSSLTSSDQASITKRRSASEASSEPLTRKSS